MLFINFFYTAILLISLLTITQTAGASVVNGVCDGVTFEVKIVDGDFRIYYKINDHEKKFIYSPPADSVYIKCVESKLKHDVLLIEEICNGSACTDDGVYAVFDPRTKKMLVNFDYNNNDRKHSRLYYENANHEKVFDLIGVDLPILIEEDVFCCNKH